MEEKEKDQKQTESTEQKPNEEQAVNKHKIPGKHRLKYDSIFKGKKQERLTEEDVNEYRKEGFEIETGTSEWYEKYNHEEHQRLQELRKEIYDLIIEKTEINLKSNRRKPGKVDFNRYFEMLTKNVDTSIHSYSDIFIELSYYFSENEYNMFKLLDQKWGQIIVKELATKYKIKKVDDFEFL